LSSSDLVTSVAPVTQATVLAEDLVKVYKGDVRALDGVSFQVPQGTVLGLLGPNGAGKTTAVRVLSTLLRPTSGRAMVAGVDVLADPEAARRVIGLAGQYAAVDEALTGQENLQLVGRLNHLSRAEDRSRATALLNRFELAEAADRTLKTYSGGMRRRLASPRPWSPDRRCCSLTNPPPGWTRAAASSCGASSVSWSRTAPPCC